MDSADCTALRYSRNPSAVRGEAAAAEAAGCATAEGTQQEVRRYGRGEGLKRVSTGKQEVRAAAAIRRRVAEGRQQRLLQGTQYQVRACTSSKTSSPKLFNVNPMVAHLDCGAREGCMTSNTASAQGTVPLSRRAKQRVGRCTSDSLAQGGTHLWPDRTLATLFSWRSAFAAVDQCE